MKGLFICLVCMACSCNLLGQGTSRLIAKGDEHYQRRQFREAVTLYERAITNKPTNRLYLLQQLARANTKIANYQQAQHWYLQWIKEAPKLEAADLLSYARLQMNLNAYGQAYQSFKQYEAQVGDDPRAAAYAESALWALEQGAELDTFVQVSPTNIETGSRSMGVCLYDKGIVVPQPNKATAEQTNFYDLRFLPRIDSITFGTPKEVAPQFDRSGYEATPHFTNTTNELFFAANAEDVSSFQEDRRVKRKLKLSENGVSHLFLYAAKREGEIWGEPVALAINALESNAAFPHLSVDGNTLYFASDRDGGFGGYDLYQSVRESNGKWSAPVNCGPKVNTPEDEIYPFITDTALFFASKGHPSLGGYDLFYALVENETFKEPINLGRPYNSSKDDFALVHIPSAPETKSGYFSSNRLGEQGDDKVFFFHVPEKVYADTVALFVMNEISEQPIDSVLIQLIDVTTGDSMLVSASMTDKSGRFNLVLEPNRAYQIRFSKKGFQPLTVDVPAENREDIIAKLEFLGLKPSVKKNTVINIPNIYFEYNQAAIQEVSYPILENVVRFLNENATVKIELSAHTDCRGGDQYNLSLSNRRAEATVNFLTEKGIAADRLVAIGYGEKHLKNHCSNGVECSEDEHQENRRVELKIL